MDQQIWAAEEPVGQPEFRRQGDMNTEWPPGGVYPSQKIKKNNRFCPYFFKVPISVGVSKHTETRLLTGMNCQPQSGSHQAVNELFSWGRGGAAIIDFVTFGARPLLLRSALSTADKADLLKSRQLWQSSTNISFPMMKGIHISQATRKEYWNTSWPR